MSGRHPSLAELRMSHGEIRASMGSRPVEELRRLAGRFVERSDDHGPERAWRVLARRYAAEELSRRGEQQP